MKPLSERLQDIWKLEFIKPVENCTPEGYFVDEMDWLEKARQLKEEPNLYFDLLSCITGLDYPEEGKMEVAYQLYSIPNDESVTIKVVLDRADPQIDSVTGIWKAADWLERETYDLMGIKFKGHPYLRRILLPADWEGHPLRKDYQEQEKYHGITVKYERE